MKRILCAVTVLTLAFLPFHAAGQGKKDSDQVVAEMMKKKLKSAHLVLEGIALADFKKVGGSAEDLIGLAKSTTWQLIRSPRYETYSSEFIRAAENLAQKARDKNVDGAALAYVEMTLACVRCHQYVRDRRDRPDARLQPGSPSAPSLARTP
jgi:hypothetical protein